MLFSTENGQSPFNLCAYCGIPSGIMGRIERSGNAGVRVSVSTRRHIQTSYLEHFRRNLSAGACMDYTLPANAITMVPGLYT